MNTVEIKYKGLDILATISDNYVKTMEHCARTCYNVEDKQTDTSYRNYLNKIMDSKHESVIEHNCLTMTFASETNLDVLTEIALDVYNSNNLIKSVINIKNTLGYGYIILSGNIRMFRDAIKNMHDSKYAELFKSVLHELLGDNSDLFMKDISLDEYINFQHISKYLTDTKDVNIDNIDTGDEKLHLGIINMDNIDDIVKRTRNVVFNKIIISHLDMYGSVTYRVKVPRVISQQDARHRIQAMSQKSQRYVNESKADKFSGFYVPSEIDENKQYNIRLYDNTDCPVNVSLTYNDLMEMSKCLYGALQEDGLKNEVARNVLTNSIYTEYCITKPYYTLDHYLHERTDNFAQYEIRTIAKALAGVIKNEYCISIY